MALSKFLFLYLRECYATRTFFYLFLRRHFLFLLAPKLNPRQKGRPRSFENFLYKVLSSILLNFVREEDSIKEEIRLGENRFRKARLFETRDAVGEQKAEFENSGPSSWSILVALACATRNREISNLAFPSTVVHPYHRRGSIVTSNLASLRDSRNIIIIHWLFIKCRFTPLMRSNGNTYWNSIELVAQG